MQFVQIVLTDDQTLLLKGAADAMLDERNREDYAINDEEAAEFERLSVFLTGVAMNPAAFPVSGKMATKIRSAVRRAKGPAQRQSRKNKRKERQARRQGAQKRRRRERRELVEQYNAAVAQLEQEQREMEEMHQLQMERVEALTRQPQLSPQELIEFLHLTGHGHLAAYVRQQRQELEEARAQIKLPGNVEKQLAREAEETPGAFGPGVVYNPAVFADDAEPEVA